MATLKKTTQVQSQLESNLKFGLKWVHNIIVRDLKGLTFLGGGGGGGGMLRLGEAIAYTYIYV